MAAEGEGEDADASGSQKLWDALQAEDLPAVRIS